MKRWNDGTDPTFTSDSFDCFTNQFIYTFTESAHNFFKCLKHFIFYGITMSFIIKICFLIRWYWILILLSSLGIRHCKLFQRLFAYMLSLKIWCYMTAAFYWNGYLLIKKLNENLCRLWYDRNVIIGTKFFCYRNFVT